jgi:hypothetical protein
MKKIVFLLLMIYASAQAEANWLSSFTGWCGDNKQIVTGAGLVTAGFLIDIGIKKATFIQEPYDAKKDYGNDFLHEAARGIVWYDGFKCRVNDGEKERSSCENYHRRSYYSPMVFNKQVPREESGKISTWYSTPGLRDALIGLGSSAIVLGAIKDDQKFKEQFFYGAGIAATGFMLDWCLKKLTLKKTEADHSSSFIQNLRPFIEGKTGTLSCVEPHVWYHHNDMSKGGINDQKKGKWSVRSSVWGLHYFHRQNSLVVEKLNFCDEKKVADGEKPFSYTYSSVPLLKNTFIGLGLLTMFKGQTKFW